MPTPPLQSRFTSDGVASACRMHRVYRDLRSSRTSQTARIGSSEITQTVIQQNGARKRLILCRTEDAASLSFFLIVFAKNRQVLRIGRAKATRVEGRRQRCRCSRNRNSVQIALLCAAIERVDVRCRAGDGHQGIGLSRARKASHVLFGTKSTRRNWG
jgi:hypothetical protein